MYKYRALLNRILTTGEKREDRTGVGTLSLFGEKMEFDLQAGFPIVTGKKTNFKASLDELLWMISGSTNVNDLNSHIWDEWADENGELGPVYGKQWRAWQGPDGPIDQLANLVQGLQENPYSRRHILSSWNVADLNQMALPPCHCFAQWYVRKDGHLDVQVYIRSNDMFLGAPFDICMYATLTHMLAHSLRYEVGKMNYLIGDAHIYLNHIEQANRYLDQPIYAAPKLFINPNERDFFDIQAEDFILHDYKHGPYIKAPIAV